LWFCSRPRAPLRQALTMILSTNFLLFLDGENATVFVRTSA
jgi:hypothetical protein